ncbi:MAG TPA: TrmH family RNA methyltransferase, partial [Anaerolineae bacterium]|nr:TrmH family RNA methyltransferase [Anaerolineae bacterium]
VTNLVDAMRRLKKQDVWLFGLGLSADAAPLDTVDLDRPLGLVIGSEGEGLRRLVRERCDMLASLPMRGAINSLNAAVAGSIALYEVLRQRGFA